MVLARILLPASYGTFKQAWLLSNTLFLVLPLAEPEAWSTSSPRARSEGGLESHALLLTTGWASGGGLLLALDARLTAFHNPELAAVMPTVAAFTAFRLAGSPRSRADADGRIKAARWCGSHPRLLHALPAGGRLDALGRGAFAA